MVNISLVFFMLNPRFVSSALLAAFRYWFPFLRSSLIFSAIVNNFLV